ncbi:uncharacterized protein DDB_G0286299-like isoform X1 [Bolinopsis microptera]|uniref:uncharacterized protein DDB_G0286299-like isoform X1 n=1 Tax=Bolinopsis microptera TaxID=2820187 RepID=UPI00307A01E0
MSNSANKPNTIKLEVEEPLESPKGTKGSGDVSPLKPLTKGSARRRKTSGMKHVRCDNLYFRSSGRFTWRELSLKTARFNTWEPESNILDQRLLDEFEDRCRNSGDLFIKEDVYDTEMSDTENNERIANRRSAPVVRSTAKRTKKKRTTRSSFKLRGSREKRAPVVKYEEIEDEVEEKLSDEEEDLEEGEKKEEKEEEVKEELTLEEEEEKEEEAPESSVSDQEAGSSAASPVRNLRNKKVAKPISLSTAKKRTPSSKFSSLMKRSRKQAQSYGMQFSRKELSNTSVSPTASSAKLSSEDGDDQVGSDEPTSVKIVKTKEQPKQKKKRAVILSEESGDSGRRRDRRTDQRRVETRSSI